MAQPGNFTPILLYSSSTPTNAPLAANLTNSTNGAELAINIADKNLFFKDSGGAVNTVPIRQSGTSSNGWLSSTDWNTFNNKGSGTITSVTGTSPVVSSGGATPAISLATAYGDTLNPYASKTANYILAAPNGSAGVPTFRALVAADLPSLSSVYIPYTGASSAIDLNAQTVTNIAHLGVNTTSVPDILLRAFGDNNSTSRIAIRGYSSNASSSSMRVAKFRGTYAAPQAPLSGDSLGKFELAGYGTTSANGYPQASYEGVATENWGATARGAKALFYVTPNTTITQAVALTLDQDKSATFASSVTATSFIGSGSSLTGVVTSVTGTSPVVSSGGATPAISMPAATTSVSGYLTSTDWNTFNNKGSGTVTSVTGTAPVVSSGGATPAISMAAATSSVNGYLTSTDWTTFNNKGSGTVTSVAALTLGTTGTDLSSTVANGTTTPVITLNVPTASATNRGALSSTDWSTFNNKQPAGSYLTAVSVVSANGFAGTSSGGTTPALTLSTSITGLLKGNGTAISAATSGTDYAPATSGSSILYGNGAGGFSNVTIGTGLTFVGGTLASTASGGTVTSVAATVPAFLSISGSPITNSGTLAITYSGTALPVANGGTGVTSSTGTSKTVLSSLPTFDTTIGVGGATASSSGSGITFPATQSASSNANTLDDYEEGTWTPNQGSGLTVVGAFSSAGTYTKVGRIVTVSFVFTAATSLILSAVGVLCTNLPYQVETSTGGFYWGTGTNAAANIGTTFQAGSTTVYGTTAIGATTQIYGSITYAATS